MNMIKLLIDVTRPLGKTVDSHYLPDGIVTFIRLPTGCENLKKDYISIEMSNLTNIPYAKRTQARFIPAAPIFLGARHLPNGHHVGALRGYFGKFSKEHYE